MPEPTRTLTTAQAIVAFLIQQYVERDGVEQPFFAGCFGIFGHGNVAGIGQALQQMPELRLLPGPQRAGDGPYRRRLRQDEEPASDARLHLVDRAGGDQHGHRRRRRDDQPPAGAAAARRHLRAAQRRAGAAAAGVGAEPGCLGQRLLQAGQPLLGPDQPPGSALTALPGGDARSDQPGRDRRRHAGAAAGRPDRGVRLSRRRCSASGSGASRATGRTAPRWSGRRPGFGRASDR